MEKGKFVESCQVNIENTHKCRIRHVEQRYAAERPLVRRSGDLNSRRYSASVDPGQVILSFGFPNYWEGNWTRSQDSNSLQFPMFLEGCSNTG